MVAMTRANNAFLPRKLYAAKAKPAIEQNSSVRAVAAKPTD